MEQKELYLPPEVFFKEILKCKIEGKISNELGRMFMLLAEKATQHRYWVRYHHIKQDMISEAILVCVTKGFAKYKPFMDMELWDGKTMVDYNYLTCYSAHAWFTKCIFNQLRGFMKAEYGVANVRNKIRLENGLETTYGYDDVLEKEFASDDESDKMGSDVSESFMVDDYDRDSHDDYGDEPDNVEEKHE